MLFGNFGNGCNIKVSKASIKKTTRSEQSGDIKQNNNIYYNLKKTDIDDADIPLIQT